MTNKLSGLQIKLSSLSRKTSVMISACLLGIECRYDGRHSRCSDLIDFLPSIHAIPFCPEQLGGLTTPRSPADIRGGDGYDVLAGRAKVVNNLGHDVTDPFARGAHVALSMARLTGSPMAVLKDKSPSCGIQTPYCDNPAGLGIGVTAALLESSGIKIFAMDSDDTFPSESFIDVLLPP